MTPSRWNKGLITAKARELGAIAVGFSRAGEVDRAVRDAFDAWIRENRHASMGYMARYRNVRFDPRLLLPGARTVISMAFPYRPAGGYHHPLIADYALGKDYHIVIKERLSRLAEFIEETTGARSRICVDTAPILERYWAAKSGIGFIGRNRQLIVPGAGSGVFLAEIVTTLEIEPDRSADMSCDSCNRCVKACPGRALTDGFDARKCLSYLTIEHRDELPAGVKLGAHIYGCDECQRVCPHNRLEPPEPLEEFYPDHRLLRLDTETLTNLTGGDWKRLTKESAMRRITLSRLLRNIKAR